MTSCRKAWVSLPPARTSPQRGRDLTGPRRRNASLLPARRGRRKRAYWGSWCRDSPKPYPRYCPDSWEGDFLMIPTPHQRVSPFRGDTTPRPSIVEGKRIWEEYQGPKFDPMGLDVTGSPSRNQSPWKPSVPSGRQSSSRGVPSSMKTWIFIWWRAWFPQGIDAPSW